MNIIYSSLILNEYYPSVGSRAITLKQAAVIAGIFEFIGAVGLGATVTKTVRKGIINFDLFEGEEDILMLGMFCALLSAALWLLLATKYALPVSNWIGSIESVLLLSLWMYVSLHLCIMVCWNIG